MTDINKIAEQKLQELYLPHNTQEWVDALRTENIKKLRKLLKKTRGDLPKKYSRLYLESDAKILILLHYMRTQFPFFKPEEKAVSQRYIDLQQKIEDGFNPIEIRPRL